MCRYMCVCVCSCVNTDTLFYLYEKVNTKKFSRTLRIAYLYFFLIQAQQNGVKNDEIYP